MESNALLSIDADRLPDDAKFLAEFVEHILPTYLPRCRWFAGKSKPIKQYKVRHVLPFLPPHGCFLVLEVAYISAFSETYLLPLTFFEGAQADIDERGLIAPATAQGRQGFLLDGLYDTAFRAALYAHITQEISTDTLCFEAGKAREGRQAPKEVFSTVLGFDQSNTTLNFGDIFFLKMYRQLSPERNPDVEVTRFLSETAHFAYAPRYAGSVTWHRAGFPDVSLGLMQEKVPNEGTAWDYFYAKVQQYFEKVAQLRHDIKEIRQAPLYAPLSIREVEPEMVDLIGFEPLKSIERLAQRTAEMHISLSSDRSNYTFLPITFNEDYAVWLKNKLILQLERRTDLVERNKEKLDGFSREYAEIFLDKKEKIMNIIQHFDESRLIGKRIRIHGDYHLGQVLRAGEDFTILDFEGEPESTIRDRKVKQSPLKDVAGIMRSFHYAVYAHIFEQKDKSRLSFEDLAEAGSLYYRSVVGVFLHTYLRTAHDNSLAIGYEKETRYLLSFHLLEKAVYELGYEMNSRPAWALIPLKGILDLLETAF